MRRLLAGTLVVLIAAGTAQAEGQALTDRQESRVEIGRGGELITIHTVNSSYEWLGLYRRERDDYQHLLLRKTETSTQSPGAEGSLGSSVRLEVLEIGPEELEPLFVIADEGETGRVDTFAFYRTYFTTYRWGCCGALDTRHTYSLLNGELLFTATKAPAWFEVPNSGGLVRLAAVHTIFSTEDEKVFGARRDALAQVTYSSPEESLQRLLITIAGNLASEELSYPDPWLGWAEGNNPPQGELTVWSADGVSDPEAVTGMTLVIRFSPRLEIRVPLVEDRLRLDQVELPHGLGLEEIPAE